MATLLQIFYIADCQQVVMVRSDSVQVPEKLLRLPGGDFSDTFFLSKSLHDFRSRLLAAGYLAASVDSVSFRNDTLKLRLHTGKLYRISSLTIKDRQGKTMLVRKNLSPAAVPAIYEQILKKYEDSGYPFVQIVPQKIEEKAAGTSLVAMLQKNDYFSFRNLIIKGDARISPKYVSRYLQLKKGTNYSETKVRSVKEKINILPFVSEIKSCETDFCDTIADLYVYLKKEKINSLQGIIGFGTDSLQASKVKFTGYISARFYNPFKAGEELFFDWSADQNSSQKLQLRTKFPYLFATPFGAEYHFFLRRQDTSSVQLKSTLSAIYNVNFQDKLALFYTFERAFSSRADSDSAKTADVRSKQFGLHYQRTALDNLFNPYRGYRLRLDMASGKRQILNERKTFVSLQARVEGFIPLPARFCLRLDARLKHRFAKFKHYPDESERIGGFHTLRGFDEDFFPAGNYAITTAELRYLLEKYSHIYMFFDMARIEYNTSYIHQIQYPMGFGGGLSFEVNSGIISIAAALGKLKEKPIRLADTKIHIGLIFRF